MKKVNFISSTLALILGFLIFGLSLIMTSQVSSSSSSNVSERKFYVGEKILPDHVFYPLLMVADKMILKTSFGERRIHVKIRLADDRLYSAKMLIEKGHEDLALSTITKSQKYLITAAQDFLNSEEQSESVREEILSALENNFRELRSCRHDFNSIDTTPIGDLLVESKVLIEKIKNSRI
jgi:hypothetical protein